MKCSHLGIDTPGIHTFQNGSNVESLPVSCLVLHRIFLPFQEFCHIVREKGLKGNFLELRVFQKCRKISEVKGLYI